MLQLKLALSTILSLFYNCVCLEVFYVHSKRDNMHLNIWNLKANPNSIMTLMMRIWIDTLWNALKNTFFYLPLWEGFELYDSDIAFYTFALLFRLHGFSDTECLVLRRRLVFLLSKSTWTSDTVSDVFLTWGLPFWTKYFSDNFSNFLSEF